MCDWLNALRKHPLFIADSKRTAQFMKAFPESSHERKRLFYSGDRIEWLLARGFHRWLLDEIEAGRAAFPD